MLPGRIRPHGEIELNGKYGDEAMQLFMQELKNLNTVPAGYQVHVYGGANMVLDSSPNLVDIGRKNIEMAYRLLDEMGFSVAFAHLGSVGRRKIAFDVWNGDVRLVHVDHRETGN